MGKKFVLKKIFVQSKQHSRDNKCRNLNEFLIILLLLFATWVSHHSPLNHGLVFVMLVAMAQIAYKQHSIFHNFGARRIVYS